MHLRHAEVFHAIMQVGTIKGAARTLGTSQSRVISVLQHFEIQLGWSLFDRQAGKLQPTPEARRLYGAMEPLVAQLGVVRRVAAAFGERAGGALRVVATPSVAGALLPAAIGSWNRRYPLQRCAVASAHTAGIVTRLLLGEADVGLSLHNPRHAGIEATVLATRPMVAAAPAGTWSAAHCAAPLPIEELGRSMVALAPGDPLGALVHNTLDAYDITPDSVTIAHTHQLAAALVAAGHGVALIDPFTAAAAGAKIQIRAFLPALPVELFMLAARDGEMSDAAAALCSEVARAARQGADSPKL